MDKNNPFQKIADKIEFMLWNYQEGWIEGGYKITDEVENWVAEKQDEVYFVALMKQANIKPGISDIYIKEFEHWLNRMKTKYPLSEPIIILMISSMRGSIKSYRLRTKENLP